MTLMFDLHVDEAIKEAKEIISREVTTIHMRNLAHIERQDNMIAATHLRVQEISIAYGKALDKELKVIQENTITEDTMIDEMTLAAQAHRDRPKEMRAHPPLNTDEDRHQLQIVETLIMPVRSCAQCTTVRVPKYEQHTSRCGRETIKTEVFIILRFTV